MDEIKSTLTELLGTKKTVIAMEDGDGIKFALMEPQYIISKFDEEVLYPNETIGDYLRRVMCDVEWHELKELETMLKR